MAATETAQPPVQARRAGRRGLVLVLDTLLAAGIVLLVAFPVLATIAADRLPLGAPAALAPLPADARPAALRDLPAGLRPGPPAESLEDLRPAATALLGERAGGRLLELARTGASGPPRRREYPYRYPTLEPLLAGLPATLTPAQVEAATDLGARMIALDRGPGTKPWTIPAAFALLDRAREGGACAPALDVLLLVASYDHPVDRIVGQEAERAWRACPGDPTAGWLLGQYQSTMGLPEIRPGAPADPRAALATFDRLVRENPGSAAAWAGQADALVRAAATTPPQRPWVARHRYERALAGYRRAARLSPGAEFDMGVARALAGLGRAGEAVAVQRRAVAALPTAAQAQAQLVVYLEQARRFGEAAAAAEQLLEVGGNAPPGPGRFPDILTGASFTAEEEHGLISLGADRLAPLSVTFFPEASDVASPATLENVSFIPVFRDSPGVTGSDRWCADWARRRDLILAGRPGEALAGFPAAFSGVDDAAGCASGAEPVVAGIARLEAGDDASAAAAQLASEEFISRDAALRRLHDDRQNLWRWAGDLGHAERAAREWVASAPSAPLPMLRLAEIEFLRGRHDDAARDFGVAARRARQRRRPDEALAARALLDRGAALRAAGRQEEAAAALREADDLASRVVAAVPPYLSATDAELDAGSDATITSYHARVQLGEAAREAGALPAAAEAYGAARERMPELRSTDGAHIEQLENNAAIVDVGLGRADSGLAAARRALAVDPENPAMLMTAGFAAERAGDAAEAIRYDRAALAADATAYPAANDLGVLLARAGRDEEAVVALRRAVGAEPRYALGWFNLGVVLAGMGPAHLLESQGALARSFTLDSDLRDREREPTIDARTYRSGLDVSRPLPPEWTFAATQKQAPAKTVGFAALLLAAFALSRALAARGSGRALAGTWLSPLDRATGRFGFLRRLAHPAVGIVATLVVFLVPLVRGPGGGVTAAVAGTLGLALLLAVALRGRGLVARREPPHEGQRTWPPGVVFALGGAAAGISWAPLPVLGDKATPRLHWAAPVALAVVALPLVVATAWSDIPLTRSLAAAALIMAASVLTPVKPVDGGAIAATGGTAAGLTGIALAVLLALGLV